MVSIRLWGYSNLAQRKRAGLITRRSNDRNVHALQWLYSVLYHHNLVSRNPSPGWLGYANFWGRLTINPLYQSNSELAQRQHRDEPKWVYLWLSMFVSSLAEATHKYGLQRNYFILASFSSHPVYLLHTAKYLKWYPTPPRHPSVQGYITTRLQEYAVSSSRASQMLGWLRPTSL
ncbi:hypothetical protein ACRALDRAFT_205666 [Sodiomyces alcalophilus JCM 7366]|uniref:uncharacterized protein n=1 Tax=Sodiomyces alcalophilus JCM 7366 TaxID=591952 RepID=UPI0039B49A26